VITVVIPYFQREPGVLRKALRSVAAQRGCSLPIRVIVVDDESPLPAESEIGASETLPGLVQMLKQRNGGPASARNVGLDAAPSGTTHIAFLDSDDTWSPDHLARAVHALRAGFDFFFGDHLQLDQTVGAFARAGRIRPDEHPPIAGLAHLHAYQGDMLDQIIRGNVIGTSTVVHDYRHFRDQRFRTEFTTAGEDYLYWMEIAGRGARIAFSSAVEAIYGKGVNVYSGAGWGTEQHLLRLHNELRYKKTIGQLFKITPAQHDHINASIRQLREAFARDLLHRLMRGRTAPIKLLAAHLRLDPMSYVMLPTMAARVLAKRA
jgi:succinoglycan biosynthesis protein ExoW